MNKLDIGGKISIRLKRRFTKREGLRERVRSSKKIRMVKGGGGRLLPVRKGLTIVETGPSSFEKRSWWGLGEAVSLQKKKTIANIWVRRCSLRSTRNSTREASVGEREKGSFEDVIGVGHVRKKGINSAGGGISSSHVSERY